MSVWDSEPERDRFVSGFQPALPGSPSAELDRMQVFGRPGTILRGGAPHGSSGGGTGGRSPLTRRGFSRGEVSFEEKGLTCF